MRVRTPLEIGLELLRAGKLDEAIEQLELATTRFPEDYRAFNYLGVAYAQKKLVNRAIGALQTAIRLRGDVANIHYNLGLVYQAEGFHEEARQEFEKALEIDPSYHRAEEALRAMREGAQEAEMLASQACARHTDEPAVALCSFCHLPVCARCKKLIGGRVYCVKCAGKQTGRQP